MQTGQFLYFTFHCDRDRGYSSYYTDNQRNKQIRVQNGQFLYFTFHCDRDRGYNSYYTDNQRSKQTIVQTQQFFVVTETVGVIFIIQIMNGASKQ